MDSNHWANIFNLDKALDKVSDQDLIYITRLSSVFLFLLGTETNIFGNKLKNALDISVNENALFIGTLLTRLKFIESVNGYGVSLLKI